VLVVRGRAAASHDLLPGSRAVSQLSRFSLRQTAGKPLMLSGCGL
jgi:hypothetical protein